MEIPIYENDTQIGTLQVSAQGLYTVFAAKLPLRLPVGADGIRPLDPDGVDRSGRLAAVSAALGETGNDAGPGLARLWLVGREGETANLGLLRPGKEGRSFCRRMSRMECCRLPAKPVKALVLPNGEEPNLPEKREKRPPRAAPAPDNRTDSAIRITHSRLTWRLLPDGSLIDPARRLLALPWAGGKLPPRARKILVKGREYWAFRY